MRIVLWAGIGIAGGVFLPWMSLGVPGGYGSVTLWGFDLGTVAPLSAVLLITYACMVMRDMTTPRWLTLIARFAGLAAPLQGLWCLVTTPWEAGIGVGLWLVMAAGLVATAAMIRWRAVSR